MNIIERNFFRLLRAGAFGLEEPIEPLSPWKWNRLYQLSAMHDVAPVTYKGIEQCRNQFFLQVPEELLQQWSRSTSHDDDEDNDLLATDHLTNPVLNRQLQDILDAEESNTETRAMLLHLLGIARFIMNAGIPVKRTVELGQFLRQTGNHIDYALLDTWLSRLKLEPMVQLASVMLVKLMHFSPAEVPFMKPVSDDLMEQQVKELFQQKNSHAEEWYFSQGKNIFIHTSNPSAMLWQVRRTAKYFRYYPSEALTNFCRSFAHSLSHIEE
jgi:hypothetical protein